MIVLGIDPGASGGLALLGGSGICQAFKMPKTHQETFEIIESSGRLADFAVLEDIRPFFNDKNKKNLGRLSGMLISISL